MSVEAWWSPLGASLEPLGPSCGNVRRLGAIGPFSGPLGALLARFGALLAPKKSVNVKSVALNTHSPRTEDGGLQET